MASPMNPLPTTADDPRLKGWYHTIDLAPGITTVGAVYDLRTTVDRVGLPESMAGMSAARCGDGRRVLGVRDGASRGRSGRRGRHRPPGRKRRFAEPPRHAPGLVGSTPRITAPSRFLTARAMLGSRVEYNPMSIYRISPETVGTFDVVYCGSLLVHLFNPLQALINIRSVTKGTALHRGLHAPQSAADLLEDAFPDRPFVQFGSLDNDNGSPGRQLHVLVFHPKGDHRHAHLRWLRLGRRDRRIPDHRTRRRQCLRASPSRPTSRRGKPRLRRRALRPRRATGSSETTSNRLAARSKP